MANNEQKRDEGYIEKLVQVNRVAKTVRWPYLRFHRTDRGG